MGDGWSNLQKFQNGMNPSVWYTPPAPQGISVSFNTNNQATVSWQPSPGSVTSYTVTIYDNQTSGVTTFTTNATSFVENLSADSAKVMAGGFPQLFVQYSVVANYGTNGSSALGSAALEDISAPVSAVFRGWQGNICFALPGLPADLSHINIFRHFETGVIGTAGDLADGTFVIPAASITNGIIQIPATQVLLYGQYDFSVQTVRSNGFSSDWTLAAYNVVGCPFINESGQMKDNLRFLLRAAGPDGPFAFQQDGYVYTSPNNYVCSSAGYVANWSGVGYNLLSPTCYNYMLRNFVYNQTNLDNTGFLTTGCYYGDGIGNNGDSSSLYLNDEPSFAYDVSDYITSPVEPASLLTPNQTTWILDPEGNGSVSTGQNNFYGLPGETVLDAYTTNGQLNLTVFNIGQSLPSGTYYDQVAQPIFQANGYYFARPGSIRCLTQADF